MLFVLWSEEKRDGDSLRRNSVEENNQNQDIKGNGQVDSLGTQRNRHSTEIGKELIYLTMRRGQQGGYLV